MRKLGVFESISLDGYFTDARNDMSWAHAGSDDPEFAAFTAGNAKGGGTLVFGRVTYEMMAAFWPTAQAAEMMPDVAKRMNSGRKFVFSRSLKQADWNNSTVLNGDPAVEMRRLKRESDVDLVVLGSGSIVAQLAQARLVDRYMFVICPIALGAGRTVFDGIKEPRQLQLEQARSFRNGKVFVSYTT